MIDKKIIIPEKKDLIKPFLDEYMTDAAVSRYGRKTAGLGIDYLLSSIYGPIYVNNIQQLLADKKMNTPIKILEFGCGAGMNLIYLLNILKDMNIEVKASYGTDFSTKMIFVAEKEAEEQLSEIDLKNIKFVVASNENLQYELSKQCRVDQNYFNDFFDLILGVNTFRYSWRNKEAQESAQLLYNMTSNGGRVIIIDMNEAFPYYLTKVRDYISQILGRSDDIPQTFISTIKTIIRRDNNLPTLKEYVEPFQNVGFEILRKDVFSWISHSSGNLRLKITKALMPILDKLIPNHAMRVLLIARKPMVIK